MDPHVPTPKRPLPLIVYGILDIVFAAVYLWLFVGIVPSRSPVFTTVVAVVAAALAGSGVGLLAGASWGRRLAHWTCVVMLMLCGLLMVLLVSSAAYLHGIYDGIGQAGAAIALLAAALSIEVVGLLPALQLAYLRRSARRGAPADGARS